MYSVFSVRGDLGYTPSFRARIPTFAAALDKAGVAKLVDALDLGSSAARLGGSSPSTRTKSGLQLYLIWIV